MFGDVASISRPWSPPLAPRAKDSKMIGNHSTKTEPSLNYSYVFAKDIRIDFG